MGLAILFITVFVLLISYRIYAVRKVNQTVQPSWSRSTPARRKMDGVNFMPSPPGVIAGFQFKSISLDVIIGPVIAVQFGWLPAILWLLFGSIFFGWVLDYFSTIISVRNGGNTISDLIGEFFNPTSRKLILVFIYIYLLTILGQFGLLFSTLLGRENVASGIIILVFAGFISGLMIYRWRINIILASFLSVMIALVGIWTTTTPTVHLFLNTVNQNLAEIGSLTLPKLISTSQVSFHSLFWILFLFAICYLIAVLPMWRIAIPINYVASWLVILTLGLAVAGLLFGTLNGSINSNFEIPPLVTTTHPNLGPIWPILFVTLSSGAVSGWHSLVSTFSTSRQIEKEPLVLPVTTGAMFTETVMVVLVIIFAATYGVSSGLFNPGQDYSLTAGPASIFAVGLAKSWHELGFTESLGGSFSALFLTIMGITVLHLVLRFSGVVSKDLFGQRFRTLMKPQFNILVIILIALLIIYFGYWQSLWVLFAGANQLLAAIVLLLASTWLVKIRKSFWWVFIPSVILFLTAMAAFFYNTIYQVLYQQVVIGQFDNPVSVGGNIITIVIGVLFMIFGVYLFYAGFKQFNHYRSIHT
ncbi:MAG: carbon starvation protein A [Chloroflexota bacterium]|nr:MAG: carbon starvation protein A [Chloroflexota bacterium]